MQIRDVFAVARKHRWIVLGVFVLTVGLAAGFAFTKPKKYEASATIAMFPNTAKGQGFVASDNLSALLDTYAETAKSSVTRARAATRLGHAVPGSIETETTAGTGILRIIGRADTPQGAVETADSVAAAFEQSIQGNSLLVASLVSPATTPTSPVQPRPPLIIGVAAVLGLLAGLLLALATEHFRRRVEGTEEIEELTSAPVIGRLPRNRMLQRGDAQLIWGDGATLGVEESFRALRTNIEFLTDVGGTVLQVTSPDAGQGKSTVVANLGAAFASVGVETLIVDADLRRPYQQNIFGLARDGGLSNLLVMPDRPPEVQSTQFPDLSVLTSGPIPPNPTELVHIRFRATLDELRAPNRLILIDSPPVLPVSDARLIAPHADGVLFVVAAGRERPAALKSALEKLSLAGANLLGIVLNFAADDPEGAGAYSYYEYKGPAAEPVKEV